MESEPHGSIQTSEAGMKHHKAIRKIRQAISIYQNPKGLAWRFARQRLLNNEPVQKLLKWGKAANVLPDEAFLLNAFGIPFRRN